MSRPSIDSKRDRIDAFLNPRNVAIVGASDKPGNYAERIYRNIVKYRFPGAVYPVNPNRSSIWDTRCYRSLSDLPEAIDHSIILAPARSVPGAIGQAAAAGARSATIISSGFGEAQSDEGHALAAELTAAIDETGLAVLGPNCLGFINVPSRLAANIAEREISMTPGRVGVVGQSGAVIAQIRMMMQERGINVGSIVTTGNEAGLTTSDFIAYFANSPAIDIVVVYLEAVRDRATFREACIMARHAGKPVIVLKMGLSKQGRAAALAHTGAMAGSIETFDAVYGPLGVTRVEGIDDLLETVECFTRIGPVRGARIRALTLSGGRRGLMIDAADAIGVNFHPLGARLSRELQSKLGPGSTVGNPLDAGFAAIVSSDVLVDCVELLLSDPETDLAVLEGEIPRWPQPGRENVLRRVDAIAARYGKPVALVNWGSSGTSDYGLQFRSSIPHLAVVQGLRESLAAINKTIVYRSSDPAPAGQRSSSSPAARGALQELLEDATRQALNEPSSKRLLSAYGVPILSEEIASSAEDAALIAERIGFPVVAKVVSGDILHKSEVGAVQLNLNSPTEVKQAVNAMLSRVGSLPGRPVVEGFLIAQQVNGDLETVIGASFDPESGPVVVFGTGGIDVELYRDIAMAAAPLDDDAARALILRTKAGILVNGYRGRPALQLEPIVRALVAVSNLISDAAGQIASIDINPFLVGETGGWAVDGLVVLNRAYRGR